MAQPLLTLTPNRPSFSRLSLNKRLFSRPCCIISSQIFAGETNPPADLRNGNACPADNARGHESLEIRDFRRDCRSAFPDKPLYARSDSSIYFVGYNDSRG